MLELDIVLERFVQQHYAALDEVQRAVFEALLDLPDTELWDRVSGAKEAAHAHQRGVLEMLRRA